MIGDVLLAQLKFRITTQLTAPVKNYYLTIDWITQLAAVI